MENLRKKLKTDRGDSEVGDASSSSQSKNLLDMPDEIIEMILDNLNFVDQDRFSICSKKINEIFQSRSKFVWLKIQESQKVTDLTRPYAKVIWDYHEVPKVQEEVWSHLAPSLKALVIRGDRQYKNDENIARTFPHASESLMAGLPNFANIVYWELLDCSDSFVEYLRRIIPVSQVGEMGKLEHLKIDVSLFLILNNRFIKFSTERLKILILYRESEQYHYGQDENLTSLISFVARQEKLKILRLRGSVNSFFNRQWNLGSIQLKDFEIDMTTTSGYIFASWNVEQQNSLVDFIESQQRVGLRNYKLWLNFLRGKSRKLLNFQLNHLDLPMTSFRFTISSFHSLTLDINSATSNGEYFVTEFLELPHRKNLITENLDVTLTGTVNHDILSCLFSKFPNIKELKLVAGIYCYNPKVFKPIASKPLGTLGSLEIFEKDCRSYNNGYQEILAQITIPNLTKFAYCVNDSVRENKRAMDLNNFLVRHKKITHLKLTSSIRSSSLKDLEYLTGLANVLKFAVETLKELKFVKSSWRQNSKLFGEVEQIMKLHATSGLVMKLVQRNGVILTLTKGDTDIIPVTISRNGTEDEQYWSIEHHTY